MAEATQNQTSAQHSAEKGIISVVFIRITQFFIFLLLTLFFSIIIEWAGMMMGIWDEPGAKHSEQMLQQELIYLNDDFKRSAIVEEPIKFAHHFANQFYLYLFEKTGIKKAIIWAASTPRSVKKGSFRNRLHTLYKKTSEYILAMSTVTQIFAVRLAVLILAMPAFVLLSFIGLIDGLVRRDIRRWSAGRESSFIYHWAKKFIYPSLILPWIIYLATPVSIHPNLVVLPFAFLFALAITITASSFKKYL